MIFTPLPAFDEITLPSLEVGSADLVIGCVVDQHAVGAVAGLAVAEDIAAAGSQADVVGLDQVPRRPHALDVDAVAQVVRDQVARAGDGAADDVARGINDARRIGAGSRRLDQHPLRAVAGREVQAGGGWSDHADLVAQNLVARRAGLDQHALRAVAGDDVVVLGIGAAHGRVRRAQDHPLLRVALPDQLDVVRVRQSDARIRVDGIGEILADEVALDQVADVGRDREWRRRR